MRNQRVDNTETVVEEEAFSDDLESAPADLEDEELEPHFKLRQRHHSGAFRSRH